MLARSGHAGLRRLRPGAIANCRTARWCWASPDLGLATRCRAAEVLGADLAHMGAFRTARINAQDLLKQMLIGNETGGRCLASNRRDLGTSTSFLWPSLR